MASLHPEQGPLEEAARAHRALGADVDPVEADRSCRPMPGSLVAICFSYLRRSDS
jgi:hypothetical protein